MKPEKAFEIYRESFNYLNKKIDELLEKGWKIDDKSFLMGLIVTRPLKIIGPEKMYPFLTTIRARRQK